MLALKTKKGNNGAAAAKSEFCKYCDQCRVRVYLPDISFLSGTNLSSLTPEEKQKKIRNLEKKLRQINDLRDKQSRGEQLDQAQVLSAAAILL